jgi:SAM-dependent methyltransferase
MKTVRKFSLQEINDIYTKYVKRPPEYFKKYENILDHLDGIKTDYKCFNQHKNTLPSHYDFSRIPCILDFKEWIKKYEINPIKKLLVTCEDPEQQFLDAKYTRKADYEVDRFNNDLHNLFLDERDFDFVLFSQTLEHVYNPQLCMVNISNHVKPGGYVFTSVPCVNLPHMTPVHFQGFTPMGLATLFLSVGLEPVEMGQFGSRKYIELLFSIGWPNYTQLIEYNKIVNEENSVSQCWILAKKL